MYIQTYFFYHIKEMSFYYCFLKKLQTHVEFYQMPFCHHVYNMVFHLNEVNYINR